MEDIYMAIPRQSWKNMLIESAESVNYKNEEDKNKVGLKTAKKSISAATATVNSHCITNAQKIDGLCLGVS